MPYVKGFQKAGEIFEVLEVPFELLYGLSISFIPERKS